jgi:hypothetical protein
MVWNKAAFKKDWMKTRSADLQSGKLRRARQEYVLKARKQLKQATKAQHMQKMKLNLAKKTRVLTSLRKYQPADVVRRSQDGGLSHKAANYGSQRIFQDQFRKAKDAARGLENLSNKPQGKKTATKGAVLTKATTHNRTNLGLAEPKARAPFLKDDPARKVPPRPLAARDTGKKGAPKKNLKLTARLKAGDILNLFKTNKGAQAAKSKPQTKADQAAIAAKGQPGVKDSGKAKKKSDTKKRKIFDTEEGKAKARKRNLGKILDGQGIETGVDLAGGQTDSDNSELTAIDTAKPRIDAEKLTEAKSGREAFCDATPAQEQVLAYFSIWKTKVLKKRLAEISELNDELTQGLSTIALSERVQGELGKEVTRFMYAPKNSEGYTRA